MSTYLDWWGCEYLLIDRQIGLQREDSYNVKMKERLDDWAVMDDTSFIETKDERKEK